MDELCGVLCEYFELCFPFVCKESLVAHKTLLKENMKRKPKKKAEREPKLMLSMHEIPFLSF